MLTAATTSPAPQRDTDAMPTAETPLADSRSTADVLKELRRAFPDMPLTERVAALNALSRS